MFLYIIQAWHVICPLPFHSEIYFSYQVLCTAIFHRRSLDSFLLCQSTDSHRVKIESQSYFVNNSYLYQNALLLLEWSIDYTLTKLVHSESICFTQVKFDYEYKLHMLVASIIVGDQQATLALWYNWPKSKDMNLLEKSDAFQCNSVQIWCCRAQIKYE